MIKNPIFLPDTNILFNLAEAILLGSKKCEPWHTSTLRYWEKCGAKTRIPSLVWAEFLGLWFHKNVDLENYDKWFENRFSVFGLLYRHLKKYRGTLCEESHISYTDIFKGAESITNQKMSQGAIKKITKRLRKNIQYSEQKLIENPFDEKFAKKKKRNEKSLKNGKLLDGLDSVIASFSCEYARKHSDHTIVVVSNDYFLIDVLQSFHESGGYRLPEYTIPANVRAALPWRV